MCSPQDSAALAWDRRLHGEYLVRVTTQSPAECVPLCCDYSLIGKKILRCVPSVVPQPLQGNDGISCVAADVALVAFRVRLG